MCPFPSAHADQPVRRKKLRAPQFSLLAGTHEELALVSPPLRKHRRILGLGENGANSSLSAGGLGGICRNCSSTLLSVISAGLAN